MWYVVIGLVCVVGGDDYEIVGSDWMVVILSFLLFVFGVIILVLFWIFGL